MIEPTHLSPELPPPPSALAPLPPPNPREGFGRLPLRRWFLLGGGAFVVVFAVAVAVTLITLSQTRQARDSVLDQIDPAALRTLELSTALTSQDGAIREYGLTGNDLYRQAYLNAVKDEQTAASAISELLPGMLEGERVRANLNNVRAAAGTWRLGYAQTVLTDVGRDGSTAYTKKLQDSGALSFTAVQSAIDVQQKHLTHLSAVGRDRLDMGWQTFYLVLIGLALVLAATLIAFTAVVRYAVLRPVAQLAQQVREVAEGDFDRRLTVNRPAELAELSDRADAMRRRILAEWRSSVDARQRLSEQTLELRRSNSELEQFAYVASHDLQEPLRKIASFTQMLEQRYGDHLDERAKQYIHFAVDGAKRMQMLINDLLGFSRVGRVGGEIGEVDCGAALTAALDNLAVQIEDTETIMTSDEMPTVRGNRVLLTQLFQNLIGNAIKFRSNDPPQIHIGVHRDGRMWEFACADNGIGVDAKYAGRIFLIFQRLHPRDVYPGTGIGLALCKKIVEYHGGEIWVDDDPGREPGATFRWTLPAADTGDDDERVPLDRGAAGRGRPG